MKYRYPLQKLVDLKANEKTQAEWMLADAIGQLQQEREALARLEREQDDMRVRLNDAPQSRMPIAELRLLQDYYDYRVQAVRRQAKQVDDAEQQVAFRQQQLTEKMKEEKVWEKAKEKAFHQFMTIMQKKEQDELDEIALTRRVQTV
ncbi:flagellar export protein FliJ [Paenibacillus koleovorans]|uniref:flagellar export protein FliJ n=1 Tax=Paenibacillus koleovorans TaxID=121608 RepID=UPI000FD9EE37|nr:flagellar export protein FliJ [Paenibacillus koleovorans]